MEGFREDPESDILVQGDYAVGAVRVQELGEGMPADEGWLGVRLKRGGEEVLGWMQAGELRERVGDRRRWARRLRGKGNEGRDITGCRWTSKLGLLQADREKGKDRGPGKVGEVVGWYMPVQVTEEKFSKAGVRVCTQMRRVAFGKEAGRYTQAVRVSSRRAWCRKEMSREELVRIEGTAVQADGKVEILVVGQEVWECWSGNAEWENTGGDTGWWRRSKQEWRDKEQAAVRRGWTRCKARDQTYDKG